MTVASDCSDATLSGAVRMRYPDGWDPGRDEIAFEIPARGHREYDLTVTVPRRCPTGSLPTARRTDPGR